MDDYYDNDPLDFTAGDDDEEGEQERGICPQCNGSGEGMYDGSSCDRCNGHGEV